MQSSHRLAAAAVAGIDSTPKCVVDKFVALSTSRLDAAADAAAAADVVIMQHCQLIGSALNAAVAAADAAAAAAADALRLNEKFRCCYGAICRRCAAAIWQPRGQRSAAAAAAALYDSRRHKIHDQSVLPLTNRLLMHSNCCSLGNLLLGVSAVRAIQSTLVMFDVAPRLLD